MSAPDLFDFLPEVIAEREANEAARQAHDALWRSPATCPACGTVEPSGYLLQNNHWYRPGEPLREHPIYGRQCIAQHLVSNHIHYAVRHPEEGPRFLAERMQRGRGLGLDVEAIVAAAREEAS